MSDHLALISRVSIFSGLSREDLQRLNALMTTRKFPRDSLIFSRDDPGSTLYIIKEGKVRVVLYGEDGREITISWYGAGDFFGEMSLLDGQPRSASVVAHDPALLLVLERAPFLQFLREHPAAGISIMVELTRRLRHATDIIGDLALLDVYGRIAHVLRDLSASGQKAADGIRLASITRKDIASLAGTTRETVSRALGDFERRGLLKTSGRSIILRQSFSM